MKVGLDFDHVLFDTQRLKELLIERFENFDDTYEDAKDEGGNYRPKNHAAMMGISYEDFKQVVHNTAERCLYDDVERLRKLNQHERLIVSRGAPSFQRLKIQASTAQSLAKDVIIVEDRPKDTAPIDFLVDDTPEELQRVDVPGLLFDRSKHTADDIINAVRDHSKQK